jgi:pimeloyl-ACP methyl ester carboxylesterase
MQEPAKDPENGVLVRTCVRGFDGTPLDAFVGGEPAGSSVLLINAIGMPVDFWFPMARRLQGFKLVTWESRWASGVDGEFSPEKCGIDYHVRDLLSVLDANGIDAAHAVAWCNGAQVALRFADQYPQRLRSMVFLNGTFNLSPCVPRTNFETNVRFLMPKIAGNASYAALYHRMIAESRGQPEANAGQTGSGVSQPFGLICRDSSILHLISAPFATPERLYRYACMITRTYDEHSDTSAEQLKLPTLLISCGNDQVSHPEASRVMAARVKGARLVVIDQGDHHSLYYDEEMQAAISGFIEGIERGQGPD